MPDGKSKNEVQEGKSETEPTGSAGKGKDEPSSAQEFDPASLRLSQDFESQVAVTRRILSVPVRKPDRQWFVRVHPEDAYSLRTCVLEMRDDRETYLVDRPLWPEMPGEIIPKLLLTAISRQGTLFLWPIRLPGEDGRVDEWNRTAMDAAEYGKKAWIRVMSNPSVGAYDLVEAHGNIPEPNWPEMPFSELLKLAFKDRFIRSLDHPAVQQLRGF